MFCGKCGTKNKSGAKFCEKCGNKLEEPEKTKKKPKQEKQNTNNDKEKANDIIFCEKCGTKNKVGAKFCEKCGNKLEESPKQNSEKGKSQTLVNIKEKFRRTPKKVKVGIGIGLLIIIAAIITLAILLNNPVKKVEDYLTSYYNNYKENYGNDELIKIGDILRNNKDNEDTLDNISNQISKTINNWVKNFNKSYGSEEDLTEEFNKLYNILREIYSYFNGLEYVLTYEEYYNYYEEIYELYNSKEDYFNAVEAEDDAEKYNYYSRVIESDSYYEEAQEFVNNYLKDELEELKSGAEELTNLGDDATNEEMLNAYLSQIEYLENNQYKNSIDLSTTEEYQSLYNNAVSKIVEYTKAYAEELETNLETNSVMDMIDNSMEALEYGSDEYNELEELKSSYEEKLPDSLTSKYLVSSTSGTSDSSYRITINDQEYDSYVSFRFDGETVSRVYRLNNEYKTFKATIVRGPDWDSDFSGEIVIYGDDKELYRSGEITKTGELNSEISIDVTDVDDLRIEFVTESEPDGWANFYIYLVEPYLYK